MNNEIETVLELLKYDNIDVNKIFSKKNINWITILGYLTYHRVAGLAYEHMKNIGVRAFEYPMYITTSMINESQKIRALEQNKWVNIISNELIKANIKHAFLKGTILNNTLYEYGSRVSNDIDILINKKTIEKVTTILKNLGFTQGKYDYKAKKIIPFSEEEIANSVLTRGETAPFVLKTNNGFVETIDLDLNFSIDWHPSGEDIVNEFLDECILITKKDESKIYSLSACHNFLELCAHFYKDSALIDILKKRKIIDLYKIVDIYYFIKKYFNDLDMDNLICIIKKFNLEGYVYFALSYTTNIFPDCKSRLVDKLLTMLEQNDVLNSVFSQYGDLKMQTKTSIIDRVFSYNVINEYEE